MMKKLFSLLLVLTMCAVPFTSLAEEQAETDRKSVV